MTLPPLETPCTNCDGVGVVIGNTHAAAWWDEHTPHGVLHTLDYCHCGSSVPPEESTCGECDGVGTILTDEGRAILALLRKRRLL